MFDGRAGGQRTGSEQGFIFPMREEVHCKILFLNNLLQQPAGIRVKAELERVSDHRHVQPSFIEHVNRQQAVLNFEADSHDRP